MSQGSHGPLRHNAINVDNAEPRPIQSFFDQNPWAITRRARSLILLEIVPYILGALVASYCRLIFALAWGVTALDMLGALRLLGDAAYLPAFRLDQLQTLARLRLAASFDAYYVGLPFFGLASTACSYLWFKSRYIPTGLAVFGVVSATWCVICAFAFLVFPQVR